MPKIEGPTVTLGFDTILLVAAVILAFFAIATSIRNGIEAIKGMSVRGRVKKLEERVDTIDKRLEKGNRKFKAQSDDIGQLLIVNQSMLMHFITGNDHDRLRETSNELATYMAERATREMEDAQ